MSPHIMSMEPPKPQYFLVRENGSMVPLIAMDELPSHVNIRNVSRTLSPYDVAGMTCVGTCEARHLQHIVDLPTSFSSSMLYDRSLMASKYSISFDQHLHQQDSPSRVYQGVSKAYGIHEQAPSQSTTSPTPVLPSNPGPVTAHTARIDRNAHPLPPWHDTSKLPVQAAPGVKEYCSYWLRHGECDYAQQGCLYKHEMPLDPAVLLRLGLRDIPRWYREKHQLSSFLAVSSTLGGGDDKKRKNMLDKDWRKGKGIQEDVSTITTTLKKMGLRGSDGEDIKREIGTPGYPSSSLQVDFSKVVAKDAPRRTQPIRRNNYFNTLNLISPQEPVETIAERQNRATLAALEAQEARRAEGEMEFRKPQKFGNMSTLASDKAELRPTSASSSNSQSTGSPVQKITTPQTSTEGSESEDLLTQDDNQVPEIQTLRPVIATQALPRSVQAPKGGMRGNAARGKKYVAQKGRRRVLSTSEADAESVAAGSERKGTSEADTMKDKFHSLYDHDD